MDSNLKVDTIKRYFEKQIKVMDKFMYRKPYCVWTIMDFWQVYQFLSNNIICKIHIAMDCSYFYAYIINLPRWCDYKFFYVGWGYANHMFEKKIRNILRCGAYESPFIFWVNQLLILVLSLLLVSSLLLNHRCHLFYVNLLLILFLSLFLVIFPSLFLVLF